MVALRNCFVGGTNATSVSTANSGPPSGNVFDAVNIPTGCTVAFDNTHVIDSSLACKVATGATGGQAYVRWATASIGSVATLYYRLYIYFTANPSSAAKVFTPYSTSTARCGNLQITTSGKVQWLNSAGSAISTSTNSIALNQWVRLEGFITGNLTTGQTSVSFYNTPDSTTATETNTSAATQNTGGAVIQTDFGSTFSSVTNVGPFWIANVAVSSVGLIGPEIPALVNVTTNLAVSPGSSFATTIPSTTAGNCLIVVAQGSNGTGTASVTSMKLGSTADNFASVRAVENADPGGGIWTDVAVWADPNCAGSQTSVTIGLNSNWAGASTISVTVFEVSGLSASVPLVDASSSGTGSSTTYDSGTTGTTAQANEFWVGAAFAGGSGSLTVPASPWFDSGINAATTAAGCSYQLTTATGAAQYTGAAAAGANEDWAALVIAFKGGQPPVVVVLRPFTQAIRSRIYPNYPRAGSITQELGSGTGAVGTPLQGAGFGSSVGANGAPVRNPAAGPVFRQLTRAVRACIPLASQKMANAAGPRGRVGSNPGTVTPVVVHAGPPFYPVTSIRPRVFPNYPRAGSITQELGPSTGAVGTPLQGAGFGSGVGSNGAPVRNPVTGPKFTQRSFVRPQLPGRGLGQSFIQSGSITAEAPAGTGSVSSPVHGAGFGGGIGVNGVTALLLKNSFDGGTNTTTITPANSGGASGNAFTSVTIGPGGSVTFSSVTAAHGTLSGLFTSGPTATSNYVQWNYTPQPGPVWFRFYAYLAANPARAFNIYSRSSTGDFLTANTNGTLTYGCAGNSNVITTVNTVPLQQWFRVEGFSIGSPNAGQLSLSLYQGDSQVPFESQTSTATLNTLGPQTTSQFGICNNIANPGPVRLDDIGLSNTGPLGPSSFPGPASLGRAVRVKTETPYHRRSGSISAEYGQATGNVATALNGSGYGRGIGANGAPVSNPVSGPVFIQRSSIRPRVSPNYLHSGVISAEGSPGTGNISGSLSGAGFGNGIGANGAPVQNPTRGPVFRQAVQPAQARLPFQPVLAGRCVSTPKPVIVFIPPNVGPAFFPAVQAVHARLPQQPLLRGRNSSGTGAPARNPGTGPGFRQAVQPARARTTEPFSKGRISSSAGAPAQNPRPGPQFFPAVKPARSPVPQVFSRGRAGSSPGAPVSNPGTGPVFRQAASPSRIRITLPARGRTSSELGGPVQNPPPPVTGPVFFPARWPARVRPSLPPRGRLNSSPGSPARNPVPGAVFPAWEGPARARIPALGRTGRVYSSPGAPVRNPVQGPVFYQLNRPAIAARLPVPFLTGRSGSNPGTVRNPTPGPRFTQAVRAIRAWLAQQPVLRGRTGSSSGAPVRNPAAGPVTYPLQGPVRARIPELMPRAGRVVLNPGAPVRNPSSGPLVTAPLGPSRSRVFPPPRGRSAGVIAASVPFTQPPDNLQLRQPVRSRVLEPPRGRVSRSTLVPPIQLAPLSQRGPVQAKLLVPVRGRVITTRMPPAPQPAVLPALHQPVRARLPGGIPRGRTYSSVLPAALPLVTPQGPRSAIQARRVPVTRGRTYASVIPQPALPVVFQGRKQAVQARLLPAGRGRIKSDRGIPVPFVAPVYPLERPVKAKLPPVPPKGYTRSNPGSAPRNPSPGPPTYPLQRPVGNAYRAPGPFRKGRMLGSAGAPRQATPGQPVFGIQRPGERWRSGNPGTRWAAAAPAMSWADGEEVST